MPTFFVIGAAKCGSTSLHSYLDLHPEISMSTVKEPMFFVSQTIRDDWAFSEVARSESEYLALFEAGTPMRGESSTAYSQYPAFPGAPEAIHTRVPEAKLVYLVRDPVERIPSAWVQLQTARMATNRRGNRLASLSEMIGPLDDPANYLVWPSMYMTQIRKFLEFFPRHSIMVVDSEELRVKRDSIMAEIFSFLGVDSGFHHPGFAVVKNPLAEKTVERDLYVRLAASPGLRRLLNKVPRPARERAIESVRARLLKPARKPVLEPDLRKRLENHLRPEADELRAFTGKTFPTWSV